MEEVQAIKHDPLAFTKYIFDKFSIPLFNQALYLASYELYTQYYVMKERFEQTGRTDKDIDKLCLSLYKYYSRMCTRCTPYGMFAGCDRISISDDAGNIMLQPENFRPLSRLDMNYLDELVRKLVQQPEIRHKCSFAVNSSLYQLFDTYYYIEYQMLNGARNYNLTSATADEHLQGLVAFCRTPRRFADMQQFFTDKGFPESDAIGYLEDLIASQVLISDLEIQVTGEDPILVLRKKLQQLGLELPLITQIIQAFEQTSPIDISGQLLAALQPVIPVPSPKNLLQTDLCLELKDQRLSSQLVNNIVKEVTALLPLANLMRSDDLDDFKRKYTERYEYAEKRLTEVLDPEYGIGYGVHSTGNLHSSTILDGIPLQMGEEDSMSIRWNKLSAFRMNKLMKAIQEGHTTITLTDKDLEDLNIKPGSAGEDLSLHGKFSIDEDRQPLFLVHSIGYNSATNMLGRFCYMNEQLKQEVQQFIADREATQEFIYAEIAHLPQSRLGNIQLRPVLTPYEIVYLSTPGVDDDHVININDLWIRMIDNRMMLFSKKLNKYVMPKMSTAHNFHHHSSLPVYKFLCDLQFQQHGPFAFWSWDTFTGQRFLPRVVYKSIIIERATWLLLKSDFESAENKSRPAAEVLQQLLQQYKVPAKVLLSSGDNELYLNLEVPADLQILQEELKKRPAILKEYLPPGTKALVKDEAGNAYQNEVVIPMAVVQEAKSNPIQFPETETHTLRREITLADNWLYIKLYCGVNNAERILTEFIAPFTEYIRRKEYSKKWFFIRYADPDHHIRLRIKAGSREQVYKILDLFCSKIRPYQDNKLLDRYVIDRYYREVERYGAANMEHTETLFFHDSEAVLKLLGHFDAEPSEGDHRWLYAIKYIDDLLNALGFEHPASKQALLQDMSEAFRQEFGNGKDMKMQLDKKYREHEGRISALLGVPEQPMALWEPQLRNIKQTAARLRKNGPLDGYLASYIHMFMNRLFKSAQRKHELVVYHLLGKYYTSALARKKHQENHLKQV